MTERSSLLPSSTAFSGVAGGLVKEYGTVSQRSPVTASKSPMQLAAIPVKSHQAHSNAGALEMPASSALKPVLRSSPPLTKAPIDSGLRVQLPSTVVPPPMPPPSSPVASSVHQEAGADVEAGGGRGLVFRQPTSFPKRE